MNNKPIIIIDDDQEDLDLAKEAFEQINLDSEIICFNNGSTFLEYLKATENRAFFILCDINMAKLDGLELKKIIYEDETLRLKCVPFLFMSTSGAPAHILKAYSYGVQGYFVKPATFAKLKSLLQSIVTYWSHSERPTTA